MKYTIKAGRHYHNNNLMRFIHWILILFNRNEISYKVRFTENMWYPVTYIVYTGYNKLFGGGQIDHHNVSARFVWNPKYDEPGIFEIFSYTYIDGEWEAEKLCDINVGQWEELKLEVTSSGYCYTHPEGTLDVPCEGASLRKILEPYFGGRDFCYTKMSVHLK